MKDGTLDLSAAAATFVAKQRAMKRAFKGGYITPKDRLMHAVRLAKRMSR